MSVMFFDSEVNGQTTVLSYINFAAFTEDLVYARRFSPSASFTGGRKLDIFLDRRATLSILCLANTLLSRPYVVAVYGM